LKPVLLQRPPRQQLTIEREINGRPIEQRLALRRERVAPLVVDLEAWMRCGGDASVVSGVWPHLPSQPLSGDMLSSRPRQRERAAAAAPRKS